MREVTLVEEKTCREMKGVTRCRTLFRVAIVELASNIAFIIEHRGRRVLIPSVVTNDKILLPIKYARFFDPIVFPEIVAVPYGRR